MGYATNPLATLQMVINSDKHMLNFPTNDQQNKHKSLKDNDRSTYNALGSGKGTLFLRQTEDNFWAFAKMPTE